MSPLPDRHGLEGAGPLLFCATDAGGARNIAPVAALAGARAIALASEVTAPLFAECGVAASTCGSFGTGEAAAMIEHERPRALVCGTSRYPGAERMLTQAARACGVPSLAVLDEWFGYRMRFADDSGALSFITDLICCPDRAAMEEATEDGLPASRLIATGSPSLSALADKVADFAARPPDAPDCWRNGSAGLRILFLSETHRDDFGDGPDRPGRLGQWLGYTELDVRAALARMLLRSGIRCTMIEKLHPGATSLPAPPTSVPSWHVIGRAPLWPLLWHADLVIGMRSMALLEAALMGHRPLSYQPNLQGPDRCTAARLGLADRARSEGEVYRWLRSPPRRGAIPRPAFADGRAASNVLEAAIKLARQGTPSTAAAS
jgi:hypothetical protein